jgi:hypothetical protein
MYRGYSPFWDWLQALLLMYTAKKRAESSPGVGKYTDFYYFKGNEPGSGFLTPECLGALECYYEELRNREEQSWLEVLGRMGTDTNFVPATT